MAYFHGLSFFLIQDLLCQDSIVLSRPSDHIDFQYSRSMSIDLGVSLTLWSHMGPGVRPFQTNIQIFGYFGQPQQRE